jgi:hypothetical protein
MTGRFLNLLMALPYSNWPPAKVQQAIVAGTAPQTQKQISRCDLLACTKSLVLRDDRSGIFLVHRDGRFEPSSAGGLEVRPARERSRLAREV